MAKFELNLGIAKWSWDDVGVPKRLADLFKWFSRTDDRPIIVLGAGGVGKTTLATLLAGKFDFLRDAAADYRESVAVERFEWKTGKGIEIVVPQGQSRHRAAWNEVLSDIAGGEYRGIIYLSAFGYHGIPGQSYEQHPLFDRGKPKFMKHYLAACQADEIDVLKLVAEPFLSSSRRAWLLGLTVKQDLWWPANKKAEAFYSGGDYGATWKTLEDRRVAGRHATARAMASLVIANFRSPDGELLAKNAAGYDHAQQVDSLRRLHEILDELRRWEGTP